MRTWRVLLATLLTALVKELAFGVWEVYWEKAAEWKSHEAVLEQCITNSAALGDYCPRARVAIQHGMPHAVATTLLWRGKWCLGLQCHVFRQEVVTMAQWTVVAGSAAAVAAPAAVAMVSDQLRRWYFTRHVRKAARFKASVEQKCLTR